MRTCLLVAAQQPLPLKRIRSLLATSRDKANKYEAQVAQTRADELLRRHGLTEADLVEVATEVAPLNPGMDGNQRNELARVVAVSRGVKADCGHKITFKGFPEAAKDARELFCALVNIVEQRCEIQGPDSDRLLWRTCFWWGFIAAIQKQLDPEHAKIPKEALASILKHAATPADVQHASEAFNALRSRLESTLDSGSAQLMAERFKTTAHDNGMALGMQIPVPTYRGKR